MLASFSLKKKKICKYCSFIHPHYCCGTLVNMHIEKPKLLEENHSVNNNIQNLEWQKTFFEQFTKKTQH